MSTEAALAQLRTRLYRAENDVRLTPAERDMIRFRVLGVLNTRPRNVGEAKRYLTALEDAIAQVSVEVPL